MSELSGEGIIWKSYDQTVELLKENPPPIFAFVLDYDGTRWPFLRAIFEALPKNEKLRDLLSNACIPMLLQADSLPAPLAELGPFGPVEGYHLAILSPVGLIPLKTFDYVTRDPALLVAEIADALDQIARI
jgi:hypothetical protein